MKEIEIKYDKLLKESKDIEFKSLPYLKTYNHFIKYFKNKKKITEHDFIIGIHAIYGWMPTILKKLDLEDFLVYLERLWYEGDERVEEGGLV